jgi:Cd2+/Zn2+-exporting ATPase
MGGGTDVALEAADTALLNSRATDVAALVRLSRAAPGEDVLRPRGHVDRCL